MDLWCWYQSWILVFILNLCHIEGHLKTITSGKSRKYDNIITGQYMELGEKLILIWLLFIIQPVPEILLRWTNLCSLRPSSQSMKTIPIQDSLDNMNGRSYMSQKKRMMILLISLGYKIIMKMIIWSLIMNIREEKK